MKTLLMSLLALNLMSGMAFAEDKADKTTVKEGCTCTKECKKECHKGKTEDCKCKECDCKSEGKTCH